MPAPCSFSCMDRSMSVNAQQAMIASRFSNKCESMDQESYSRAGYRTLGHVSSCALLVPPSPSLPLIPGKAAHSRGTCGRRARTCILKSPNSEPCCCVRQVQCWPICLKTSLFPIAPSGTARLGSCWTHLAAFWDPFGSPRPWRWRWYLPEACQVHVQY